MKLLDWFIPNKKNNFHPVALRVSGLIIFLIVFSLLPLTYNITTTGQARVLGYATSIKIYDLNNISNQQRTSIGLAPLNLNSDLSSAAYAKAQDMFADNYWEHVAPDGTTPWSFILSSGYNYSEAGENLAKNFDTSGGVVNGWMNSHTHAANVLKSSYTDVGYAVVNGKLLGEETTLVVVMYGSPATPASIASTTPIKPQSQPVKTHTTETSPDQTKISTTVSSTNTAIDNRGVVDGVMSSLPIQVYSSLNWGQKASLLLLCAILLLFVLKHTLIWREQKRGLRHIWLRAHPIGQIVIVFAAIVVTLTSGVGVIL